MQSLLRGGAPLNSLPVDCPSLTGACAADQVRSYFANAKNRSLMGTYAGSTPTLTRYQDRAAFLDTFHMDVSRLGFVSLPALPRFVARRSQESEWP